MPPPHLYDEIIDWGERWPNFAPNEVLSPSGIRALAKGRILIQPHALDFLQAFRESIGKPFKVNYAGLTKRGYRDCIENREAGGRSHSYHIQGLAFDVTIEGVDSHQLVDLAIGFGWTGVGRYKNFVHMDKRTRVDAGLDTWLG
jgi:hypothetical protein